MRRPPICTNTKRKSLLWPSARYVSSSRQSGRGIVALTIRVRIVVASRARLLPRNPPVQVRRSLESLANKAEISVHTGECAMNGATRRSVGAGLRGWRIGRLVGESSRGQRQRTENRCACEGLLHSYSPKNGAALRAPVMPHAEPMWHLSNSQQRRQGQTIPVAAPAMLLRYCWIARRQSTQ